jgi:hypothetical protein
MEIRDLLAVLLEEAGLLDSGRRGGVANSPG